MERTLSGLSSTLITSIKEKMDNNQAILILNMGDDFTQINLIRSYQEKVQSVGFSLSKETDMEIIGELSNKLFEISEAYHLLRNIELVEVGDGFHQPLIIFTDASVYHERDIATFGIVVQNIPNDFNLPVSIIEKFGIQHEKEFVDGLCVLSGEIVNFDVDTTEIMGILVAMEIFMFLVKETDQTMVFYTDSLRAKKILTDKKMPANTKMYSELRRRFNRIIETNGLDVVVKKVKAHSGIELNDIADSVAKNRNNQLNGDLL
jgi:ribonuclease HI